MSERKEQLAEKKKNHPWWHSILSCNKEQMKPNLTICIENEKPFYNPGDNIKGFVTLIPEATFYYYQFSLCVNGRVAKN